jgi:hypothetical protein
MKPRRVITGKGWSTGSFEAWIKVFILRVVSRKGGLLLGVLLPHFWSSIDWASCWSEGEQEEEEPMHCWADGMNPLALHTHDRSSLEVVLVASRITWTVGPPPRKKTGQQTRASGLTSCCTCRFYCAGYSAGREVA